MKRTLFDAAADLARSEGQRLLNSSPIAVRLELAVRTYRATKREGCSLETQLRAAVTVETLLTEARDTLPNLTGEKGSELARAMKAAEVELRAAVEAEGVVRS
jgi:hypothetical protein